MSTQYLKDTQVEVPYLSSRWLLSDPSTASYVYDDVSGLILPTTGFPTLGLQSLVAGDKLTSAQGGYASGAQSGFQSSISSFPVSNGITIEGVTAADPNGQSFHVFNAPGQAALDVINGNGLQFTVNGPNAYNASVLADSPAVYLPLNETTGTTAKDLSVNGNNGTYSGGFTLNQTGPQTGVPSVKLNGSSGWIVVPDSSSLRVWGPGQTLEGWANWASVASTQHFMSKGWNAWNCFCELHSTGNGITYYAPVSGFSTTLLTTILASTWYHIVITYDGATVKLYVNGSSVASTSLSTSGSPPEQRGEPFTIGSGTDQTSGPFTGNGEWANANVARFAHYPGALSSTRVAAHFNAASQPNTSITVTANNALKGYPQHVVATYDPVAMVATIYVDGVAVASSGAAGSVNTSTTGNTQVLVGTGASTCVARGQDIAVYNGTLSPSRISQHFAAFMQQWQDPAHVQTYPGISVAT